MTNQPQDPDLRALFRALREEEEVKAPSFPRVLSEAKNALDRPEPQTVAGSSSVWFSRRRLAWGGSLLAAAAVAAVWLLPSRGTSDAEFVLAISAFSSNPAAGAWRSPTDALLEVPGSEVLNTRPKQIGRAHV